MDDANWPLLPLSSWQPTRDTLQVYGRLLSKLRGTLAPRQPHWEHISLRVVPDGLTTTAMPIPGAQGQTVEMILGLGPQQGGQRLVIRSSRNQWSEMPLRGQSPRRFADGALGLLADMGIHADVDHSLFDSTEVGAYDVAAVERFARALNSVDTVLKRFRAELPGQCGPVQFWTHHFDLALMWLTGRQVPGVDPADEERADEQIPFGFSTGDEGTPDPYLYVTPYPWPEGLNRESLPAGGTWHSSGWRGAQLMYNGLAEVDDPQATLLEFLRSAFRAASSRMQSASE